MFVRDILFYFYHKLRERKVKALTRNWRDHKRTGTHKHMETVSRYFDGHRHFSQSEESECMWTHDKGGITRVFERWKVFEGYLKGNYLRLIPGLCLEDRINW